MNRYLAGRPEWGKTRTVLQNDPQGLGQAISLALSYVDDDEPLPIILGDTLFDANLGQLAGESENVLYTYKVQDPRRFGVAVTDENGRIKRLVEKPQEFVSDEAIVGVYCIKDVKELRAALKHLMDNDIEYSGQKKPLVRNGGNCNTDFKETILIVLFFAQFRMLGPRGILNHVRASHSQTSIFKGGMYMRMRDAGLIQPKANHKM